MKVLVPLSGNKMYQGSGTTLAVLGRKTPLTGAVPYEIISYETSRWYAIRNRRYDMASNITVDQTEGTILVEVAYCPYCGIKCKDRYAELYIFPKDQTSVCRHDPLSPYSGFCEIPDGWDES